MESFCNTYNITLHHPYLAVSAYISQPYMVYYLYLVTISSYVINWNDSGRGEGLHNSYIGRMPRQRKKRTVPRDSTGQFIPRRDDSACLQCTFSFPVSSFPRPGAWSLTSCAAVPSEVDLLAATSDESDSGESDDGGLWNEIWQGWEARRKEEERQRKEKELQKERARLEKLRAASVKSAEHALDGAVGRSGGARDKTGEKRGAYSIGGDSERTAQRKWQKIRREAEAAGLDVSSVEVQRRLDAVQARKPDARVQLSLTQFLRKPAQPAACLVVDDSESDPELLQSAPHSHEQPEAQRLTVGNTTALEDVDAADEDESNPSEGSEDDVPLAAHVPVSESPEDDDVRAAEEIAEYVEDVLETTVPKSPQELETLAAEGLRKARKAHDYRSEVLFSCLIDFYRMLPRYGRLRTALRISRNHQRGPAFARVLCAQARHFKTSEGLKPSRQGQKCKGESTLDNEAVFLGIQAWLRTLKPGEVSVPVRITVAVVGLTSKYIQVTPKLLQTHLNTTLLPSLQLSKRQLSLRQARHWLWKLGYRRKRHSKGVYWDGHERKDVKQRRKAYLAELESFEP